MAATNDVVYPARLDGALDEPLSRWRWLVKWFLAIPHFLALLGLWVAVLFVSIYAFFAILITGRYPRKAFDFVVGVLRWSWRVGFYACAVLGTDKYPPFSLQPDPSYPASFTVDYPERLSRGLVLVKWWLLALPQLLIIAVFTSGLGAFGGGVIGILTIAAGVVLLVQQRYPGQLFEVVMGLNRWCYRVLTYVLLLRDEYPPFHYDGGGTDPGSPHAPEAPGGPLGEQRAA